MGEKYWIQVVEMKHKGSVEDVWQPIWCSVTYYEEHAQLNLERLGKVYPKNRDLRIARYLVQREE